MRTLHTVSPMYSTQLLIISSTPPNPSITVTSYIDVPLGQVKSSANRMQRRAVQCSQVQIESTLLSFRCSTVDRTSAMWCILCPYRTVHCPVPSVLLRHVLHVTLSLPWHMQMIWQAATWISFVNGWHHPSILQYLLSRWCVRAVCGRAKLRYLLYLSRVITRILYLPQSNLDC